MKFLVQFRKCRYAYDFCFEMKNAQDYAQWRGEPFELGVLETESEFRNYRPEDMAKYDGYIPVGSVEFVSDYYHVHYPLKHGNGLLPLNVPERLFPYAGRMIFNVTEKDAEYMLNNCMNQTMYRKSTLRIKDPMNGLTKIKNIKDITDMQLSSNIEDYHTIRSEWRVLVFHDKVQHIGFYSGNPMAFPNANRIMDMVNAYAPEAPVAYTLDVYVTEDIMLDDNSICNTFVMECHRFFSCGLYGFCDYSKLPYMFSQEWYEILNMN